MPKSDKAKSQRGVAVLEVAIGMLFLIPLFMVLVEGTNALRQYATLQNAAMEGARMMTRQDGDTSGVETYIDNLLVDTDCSSPAVTFGKEAGSNQTLVTVQVEHAFTPFFTAQTSAQSESNPFGLLGMDALTLSANVTMAVAESN